LRGGGASPRRRSRISQRGQSRKPADRARTQGRRRSDVGIMCLTDARALALRRRPLRPPRSGRLAGVEAGHPAAVVGEFVLRLAGKEVNQTALDALALEQGALDLAGDRHLDAESLGQG